MKSTGSEIIKITFTALPLIFSNLLNAAASLISMYLIAKIDTNSLAASALITSTYGFIIMLVISMLYSISIVTSKMHGANQHHDIGSVVFAGNIITIILGIPLTALMLHMSPVFRFLGQPEAINILASDYFKGCSFGLIPSLISSVYMQLLLGTRSAKIIPYITGAGVIINSILTVICIFGLGAIPAMHIYGAGIANSITAYVILALILLYISSSKHHAKHALFQRSSYHLKHMISLLKIGIPISIQFTSELFAFSALTYLMGILGTAALQAQQISLQCGMIGIMISMGISQAGTIIISRTIGAGESARIPKIICTSLFLGFSMMLIISLIYWFFPLALISLYINTNTSSVDETIYLTKIILAIAAFTQIFDSVRNIAAGLLRGLGDTKTSMLTSIISCWTIGIPAALLLGFIWHLGAPGIRLGMLLGILSGCIHLLYRLYLKLSPTSIELAYSK